MPRRRPAVKPAHSMAVNRTSNVTEHKKGRHASGAAPSMRELLGRRSQISLLLAGGSMGWGARGTDVFF